MRTIAKLIIMSALLLAPAISMAGGDRRLGTAGALELLIPTDARGAAMGGSVIAGCDGVDALSWNPAGAAGIENNELSASHRIYIAGITLDHVSYGRNLGSAGVLGLSAKVLSMGDERVYTTSQPEGTGETFSTSFVVVGISYARTLTDRVSFGINGNYVSEQISRETARGLAFDMGFVYRPTLTGLTLGIVAKNYGPTMKFDGPDFSHPIETGQGSDPSTGEGRTQSASFELPSFIQFGVAWDALARGKQHLRLTSAYQSNSFSQDEFRFGSEWGMADQLFLRGGYSASSRNSYIYGLSLGAGLRVPWGGTVTTLDYTWAQAGVFESNHFFTVKLRF
ncbi:MAG: PorV/PorQ family protein [candidate division Zixibacteria bacterium]|nr:PorV/PorQ family protein [candidate division Zixibacteria bacterium]